MKTCLILGATGFIGGHIARAAAARGWQVRALRRDPNSVGAIGDVPVEWVTGDLNRRASLSQAMRGCRVVFHSAGAYPHGTRQIERAVQGALEQMRNVIAAARDVNDDRLAG
jgi:nucleoside-diphosphate-sugar epimerase